MRLSTEALLSELQRFQVLREDLVAWENALGLSIPTDMDGKPAYSEHHVNLFKNIKKHLALGKSFTDIQHLVQVPQDLSVSVDIDSTDSPPASSPSMVELQSLRPPSPLEPSTPRMTSQPHRPNSPLMASPRHPSRLNMPSAAALAMAPTVLAPSEKHQNELMDLLRQTMSEKDQLQQQLIDIEKLNSHLNNANGMFHRKVKQLTEELKSAQAAGDQNRLFQLMEDKARLHHQVLDSEKTIGQLKKQLTLSEELMLQARQDFLGTEQHLTKQIQFLQSELSTGHTGQQPNTHVFCGHWNEEAYWLDTRFDTYGVDIPSDRQRVLSIAQPPTQLIGPIVVLSQTYRLDQQPQWQRTEALLLVATTPTRLQGLMDVTYRLNETPVAQARYRISATKQT